MLAMVTLPMQGRRINRQSQFLGLFIFYIFRYILYSYLYSREQKTSPHGGERREARGGLMKREKAVVAGLVVD